MSWVFAGVASGMATNAAVSYFAGKRRQKKDEANRPEYEIPPEIAQNLNQADQMALQGLPAEQKQQFLQNVQRGSAYQLGQIGSRKGGLAGVAAINQNQNDAYTNMLVADSNARISNQRQQMAARQQMADYRDQAFQINEINPYYENIARREARIGALSQNLNNAGMMGAGIGGMGGNKGGSPQQAGTQTPQLKSMNNPYANQNVGTYTDPNTSAMFNRNPYNNPYAYNSGTYTDPNNNMFDRNPYY